jgi:hypothetical protein
MLDEHHLNQANKFGIYNNHTNKHYILLQIRNIDDKGHYYSVPAKIA